MDKLHDIVKNLKDSKADLGTSGENLDAGTEDTSSSITEILANIDSLDTKRFIKWEQEIIWKYMVNFDGESKKEEFMWYERQNTEENDVLRTVLPCEYINDDGLKETTSSGKELTRLGF